MSSLSKIPEGDVPSSVFLFGLAGAGKTYCGNLLSNRLGYFCYDLDTDCTSDMKAAIAEGRAFTEKMRDDFFGIVSTRIGELKALHPRLIVMQAAYKERHRALVTAHHPGLAMVWVDAPDELISQRLEARGDSVSAEYATRIRANFEAPAGGPRLVNDVADPEQILSRFVGLFASQRP